MWVDWHTLQSQPTIGTPVDVPVPRKVNVRELGMGFLELRPKSLGQVRKSCPQYSRIIVASRFRFPYPNDNPVANAPGSEVRARSVSDGRIGMPRVEVTMESFLFPWPRECEWLGSRRAFGL